MVPPRHLNRDTDHYNDISVDLDDMYNQFDTFETHENAIEYDIAMAKGLLKPLFMILAIITGLTIGLNPVDLVLQLIFSLW